MTDHGHHNHEHGSSKPRALAIALGITLAFLIVEVIGGLLTGSLALLADAGHMATDVAALALALFAGWLARRPATPERSFGFRRAEVLAALVNGATLVAISIYIFWEAFRRIGDPPDIDSGPMLAVAIAGLAANAASAWVLSRGGGHQHDLNTRGAFLHVIGDMLGSVGAILAALIMLATGWYLADPLLSAGIGLLILWSSWRLVRESTEVLLEATPEHIDAVAVRREMMTVTGVTGVHDLHIWTVTSGLVSLSAHVECEPNREWNDLLVELAELLRDQFGIAHITLQPEMGDLPAPLDQCTLDTPAGRLSCLTHQPAPNQEAHHDHAHAD